MKRYDCIIIGAGSSGLMCAIKISSLKKVLIIEKNNSCGKKLLLTGGGRCNVTNLKDANLFLENIHNKKYLYSAIHNFGPQDIYDFFTSRGCFLKEELDNKIFPKNDKASSILNCLMSEIKSCDNVKINYNETVVAIEHNDIIKVFSDKGCYEASTVVVATGGKSFPKTGSSGDHIKFSKMLNQPIIDLYPAETSIILKEKHNLAGTSLSNVKVTANNHSAIGNILFTHNGLSGDTIMKLSEYIYLEHIEKIYISFLEEYSKEEICDMLKNYDQKKEIKSFIAEYLTKNLAIYLLKRVNIAPDTTIKTLTAKKIGDICLILKKCPFLVLKSNDLDKAYITGGGIDMKYIDSKTMESTVNKNIYFIGEALDVHGTIGGYNITIAFSTASLAAQSINNK